MPLNKRLLPSPSLLLVFSCIGSLAHAQGASVKSVSGTFEISDITASHSPSHNLCHPDFVPFPGSIGETPLLREQPSPGVVFNDIYLHVKTPDGESEIWDGGCNYAPEVVAMVGKFVGNPGYGDSDEWHRHFEASGEVLQYAPAPSPALDSGCESFVKNYWGSYSKVWQREHAGCMALTRRVFQSITTNHRPIKVEVNQGVIAFPQATLK